MADYDAVTTMTPPRAVPWGELDTIFFDAGNTFLSMNFERIAEVASDLGLDCSGLQLERAEAAARPDISAALSAELQSTEGGTTFRFYLEAILTRLPAACLDGVELAGMASGACGAPLRVRPERSGSGTDGCQADGRHWSGSARSAIAC